MAVDYIQFRHLTRIPATRQTRMVVNNSQFRHLTRNPVPSHRRMAVNHPRFMHLTRTRVTLSVPRIAMELNQFMHLLLTETRPRMAYHEYLEDS